MNNQFETVKFLIKKGAGLFIAAYGSTPFEIALAENRIDLAHLLAKSMLCSQSHTNKLEIHRERTKFLYEVINACLEGAADIMCVKGNAKCEHVKDLKTIANFLYLQNLWAHTVMKISFLQEQLKELNWPHGLINSIEMVGDAEQISNRFVKPGVMLIATQGGMAADLMLSQSLMRNPFKLTKHDVQLVDDYMHIDDEEVKLVSSAFKYQYLYKELHRQIEYMWSILEKKSKALGVPYSENSCICMLAEEMAKSFSLVIGIKQGACPLDDAVVAQSAKLLSFVRDNHIWAEALYILIRDEIQALTASAGSYNVPCVFDNYLLPERIRLVDPFTSFDGYFEYEEQQKATETAARGALSGSSAAATSSDSWVAQAKKTERARREAAKRAQQVKQTKKARRQATVVEQAVVQALSPAQQVSTSKKERQKKPQVAASAPSPASPTLHAAMHAAHVVQNRWKNPLLSYDTRVNRWFKRRCIQEGEQQDVLYHSFAKLSDPYIMRMGIKTPWHNRTREGKIDTSYSLPGMVIFPDGTKKYAVFSCTVDAQGCCYHRGITYKHATGLIREFSGAKLELDHRDIDMRPAEEKGDDEHVTSSIEEENTLMVKIRDTYNNVDIVLFRLPETSEQVH